MYILFSTRILSEPECFTTKLPFQSESTQIQRAGAKHQLWGVRKCKYAGNSSDDNQNNSLLLNEATFILRQLSCSSWTSTHRFQTEESERKVICISICTVYSPCAIRQNKATLCDHSTPERSNYSRLLRKLRKAPPMLMVS